jgi:hypothetical protein
MNSKEDKVWDEVTVACVKALSKGYYENPQPGQSP